MATCDRTHFAAQRLLLAFREERRKHGDTGQEDPDAETESIPAEAEVATEDAVDVMTTASGEPASEDASQDAAGVPEASNRSVLEAPQAAVTPAENPRIVNEAVAPQVDGPIGGYDPISPAPADRQPFPTEEELAALPKVVQDGYREFAQLRESADAKALPASRRPGMGAWNRWATGTCRQAWRCTGRDSLSL